GRRQRRHHPAAHGGVRRGHGAAHLQVPATAEKESKVRACRGILPPTLPPGPSPASRKGAASKGNKISVGDPTGITSIPMRNTFNSLQERAKGAVLARPCRGAAWRGV